MKLKLKLMLKRFEVISCFSERRISYEFKLTLHSGLSDDIEVEEPIEGSLKFVLAGAPVQHLGWSEAPSTIKTTQSAADATTQQKQHHDRS